MRAGVLANCDYTLHTVKVAWKDGEGLSSEFVAYLDAIGGVDGVRCLIDWKTTTSRYTEAPEGLLSRDPQLISYSWHSARNLAGW